MSDELARVGESRLDHAIRLTGLSFTQVQKNAVTQLFLWHGEIETIEGVVTLAKLVHKKDDAFWLRKDLSIEQVIEELFGSEGMTAPMTIRTKQDLVNDGFFDKFHENGLRVDANHRESRKFSQTVGQAEEAKREAESRRAKKNARRAEQARKAGLLK